MTADSNSPGKQRERWVTKTETRRSFHAMLRAASSGEHVVITEHGKPRGVVISIAELENFRRLKAEAKSASTEASDSE